MDTIIGLGAAGCNIAEKFAEYSQYKVLKVDSERRPFDWLNKGFKLIPEQKSPEEYEENCPFLDDLIEEIDGEIGNLIRRNWSISVLVNETEVQ